MNAPWKLPTAVLAALFAANVGLANAAEPPAAAPAAAPGTSAPAAMQETKKAPAMKVKAKKHRKAKKAAG